MHYKVLINYNSEYTMSKRMGLSNVDRDLLTKILNYLRELYGPAASNFDKDLLQNMLNKLDTVLMNKCCILNEIFPSEAIIERPKNCSSLSLRDEKSF
ncbi:hypothetical protein ACFW04_014124 [Cataglyphis niger]